MVLDDPDWCSTLGKAQHQLREISSSSQSAGGTEHTGGTDHERILKVGLCVEFPRQLGDAISAERPGRVRFGIRAALLPVENVICREVDKLSSTLAAGQSEVADGKSIYLIGGERF